MKGRFSSPLLWIIVALGLCLGACSPGSSELNVASNQSVPAAQAPEPTAPGPTQGNVVLSAPEPTAVISTPAVLPTDRPAPAPLLQGRWYRITTANGLCTDWPLLIGHWYIGSGTQVVCFPDSWPSYQAAWSTLSVPVGTRATAAVKFPPGGGLGVATDAGPCHYEPGQLPGAQDSWECDTPAEGFPYSDIRNMVGLGTEPVYMLSDAVAFRGTTYSIPDIVESTDARPTWIAVAGEYEPDPEIWVGTNGYGLVVIRTSSGQTRRYTTADGLPGDAVRDVQVHIGKMGHGYPVWVATVGGVGRWDGRAWTAFTTADGLPSNDVRGVSTAGPSPDTVWASTAGGPAYYDGILWYVLPPVEGVPEGDINGVMALGEEVWFSTRGSGLLVFVGEFPAR